MRIENFEFDAVEGAVVFHAKGPEQIKMLRYLRTALTKVQAGTFVVRVLLSGKWSRSEVGGAKVIDITCEATPLRVLWVVDTPFGEVRLHPTEDSRAYLLAGGSKAVDERLPRQEGV